MLSSYISWTYHTTYLTLLLGIHHFVSHFLMTNLKNYWDWKFDHITWSISANQLPSDRTVGDQILVIFWALSTWTEMWPSTMTTWVTAEEDCVKIERSTTATKWTLWCDYFNFQLTLVVKEHLNAPLVLCPWGHTVSFWEDMQYLSCILQSLQLLNWDAAFICSASLHCPI